MLSTLLVAVGTAVALGATVPGGAGDLGAPVAGGGLAPTAVAATPAVQGPSAQPIAGSVVAAAATETYGGDPDLFRAQQAGSGAYAVPVGDAGTFRVSLRFARPPLLTRRLRSFDVYAEQVLRADDVDVSSRSGARQSGILQVDAAVADGTLDLRLAPLRAAATLTSIDVTRLSAAAAAPVTPSPGAGPLPAASTASSVACGYGTFRAGAWPGACWRPYGDHSPFNRKVPADARVLTNSSSMVSRVLRMGPVPDLVVKPDSTSDWYHPVYYGQASDPLYTVHCTRTWGRCEVEGMQVRIPSAARAAGGGDGHMTVIDQVSGWEYDFWQVASKPATGGTITISWGGRTEITGDGLGSDATAAHFGLHAGIIRAAELEAGRIDHALFLVVGCTSGFVWPAAGTGSTCADTTNAPAIGQHFRLDMSASQIDALPVPAWKKTILRALAEYGAFVGDTGGNESFGFMFESGSSYTSFGAEDPMRTFARKQTSGVAPYNGGYYFDMASGVDWTRMRALDPCVAKRTC